MNYGFTEDTETARPGTAIANDAWFVDVNLKEFAENWQIALTFTDELLTILLITAMDDINQTLATWASEQTQAGYATLIDVPAQTLGGVSAKVTQYKRAIYASAKAELIKNNISLSRKAEAASQEKTSDDLSAFYETMASKAIARVMDESLIGVHLV